MLAARFALAGATFGGCRDVRVANAAAMVVAAVPWLVAAVVGGQGNASVAIGLFWAALGMQLARNVAYSEALKVVNRMRPLKVLPVVDVESLAERYGLVTLIHLGEVFIATIVEGNNVFQDAEGRDGAVVLPISFAIIAVFAVHTLYFDLDSRIGEGDVQCVL